MDPGICRDRLRGCGIPHVGLIVIGQHIQEWAKERIFWPDQLVFVRDALTPLVGTGMYYSDAQQIPRVIGEHRSKSTTLPVYSLARPDLGVRFVMRNSFYDWKLSVISERPIESDALRYLSETEPPREPGYDGRIHRCYFEGFPPGLIFGYYSEDHSRFSLCLASDYALWTAVFEVMRALGALPVKRTWTEAEHRAYLDADNKRWREEQAKRKVG